MNKADLAQYPITGRFLAGRRRDLLSQAARQALEDLFGPPQRLEAGTVLERAFAPVERVTILIEGFALRAVGQGDERSVVGIQLPGDLIDLPALGLGYLDHDLLALGPITIARTSQQRLRDLALASDEVGRALWVAIQLDGTIQRQWAVKLGRLKASRRVARVLSEVWCRLDMVGLADDSGYHIPMTQQDLADMCGTTAIHLNRALGELRRMGLADLRRGVVTAPDRKALESYGGFRKDYLTTRVMPTVNVRAA